MSREAEPQGRGQPSWMGCRQFVIVVLAASSAGVPNPALAQRPFTAADDIGLVQFLDAGHRGTPIGVSPDARFFAVVTERGLLDENVPEDTIWIFRSDEVRRFVQHPAEVAPPLPVPLVKMASEKNGPIIEQVRWLDDSSGVAFLAVKKSQTYQFHQLMVADITTGLVKALTPDDQNVDEFDISGGNYVYQVSAPKLRKSALDELNENEQPATALTGKSLFSIILRERYLTPFDQAGLWVVTGGKRIQVRDAKSHHPFTGGIGLSISPDGRFVVMISTEDNPPEAWAKYKSPPGYERRPASSFAAYYLINLQDGTKKRLVDAPAGKTLHWSSGISAARWSADGQSVLMPNTFLPLGVTDPNEITAREMRPCVAALRLTSGQLSCVLPLRGGFGKEHYSLADLRFENDHSVVLNFDRSRSSSGDPATAVFRLDSDGSWENIPNSEDPKLDALPFRAEVHQDLNHSPVITVEDKASHVSRTIWDPNPQIKYLEVGVAEVMKWKDQSGYEWEAGLVKPPGYIPGRRYPLVIQTHGFDKSVFISHGIFSTAFAARALASAGIVVLQMGWNPSNFDTPKEGSDQIAGFESAVEKLAREGVIDPARVGVIGFSRTVYHVLEALTVGRPKLAAASLTDGVTMGYFEYIFCVDWDLFEREAEQINGGEPFDEAGMKNWLSRSPGFNMAKADAPLLLVQPGLLPLLGALEPYAALRHLNKPVDLIMLQPGTHVMTNPQQRLLSESINVDWFRFWLQDYEDPDPSKAEQYARWRGLRKLQEQNGKKSGNAAVPPSN